MNKNLLMKLAGGLWGAIGAFMLYRGFGLYQLAVEKQHSTQKVIIISLALGVILGIAKGIFVLSKTARRNKARIESLSAPLKVYHVYPKSLYILIPGMILLGILLRNFNQYLGGYVVVGAIYCGIGLALIVSSRVYWKTGLETPAENI